MDQIEFNEGKLSIGRNPNNDIVIDNAGVSSHHAVIEKKDHSFLITDNSSKNGVFINGNRIEQHTLKYWDEIQIYNYVLKFMAVAGLQETGDPDLAQDGEVDQSGTMEVAMSDVQNLLKLREQKKDA
ncbi:MAG: FHA domain-containing protein, partial [Bacteroidetes bacterium]|nr:FHA domain-containing protein [Bacteroidota bacterium]